jgi:arylsulfatase A-like enzyme
MAVRAGLLCIALCAACGGGARERIVLVTLDTCRSDALASMPELAAFAARGARFTFAYSASSATQPTHASLFTGLHPWQHGVTENGQVLPDSAATLAEVLAEHGFDTAAVVASFPLRRTFGFMQGFRIFRDEFRQRYVAEKWGGEEVAEGQFFDLGEDVTDKALAALEELEGPKQFLWVHYFDAHDPYGDAAGAEMVVELMNVLTAAKEKRPGIPKLVETLRALYARDLAALDRALGRLLARLAEEDGFTTHVIVTADHGESLGEQGSLGHGRRLRPEQLRIPLAVVSPRVNPGERADTAGSIDVHATLLALAGVTPGDRSGRDLTRPAPADAFALGMRQNTKPRPEYLLDGTLFPVEGTRFYLARGEHVLTGDSSVVLRDDDPARPLPDTETRELRNTFHSFQSSLDGTSVETLDSAEVQAALRALGYGE